MTCFKKYVLEIWTEVVIEQTLVASVCHDKRVLLRSDVFLLINKFFWDEVHQSVAVQCVEYKIT